MGDQQAGAYFTRDYGDCFSTCVQLDCREDGTSSAVCFFLDIRACPAPFRAWVASAAPGTISNDNNFSAENSPSSALWRFRESSLPCGAPRVKFFTTNRLSHHCNTIRTELLIGPHRADINGKENEWIVVLLAVTGLGTVLHSLT